MSGFLNRCIFADEESRANAKEAIRCAEENKRGAFLILGEACTGKTLLMKEIARQRLGATTDSVSLTSIEALWGGISYLGQNGVMLIENLPHKFFYSKVGEALMNQSVCSRLQFRKLRGTSLVDWLNQMLILASADGDLLIPEDVERRFKIIRLLAPKNMATVGGDPQTPAHYAKPVTPWDLQRCMESSGNAFVDARRTDAIEYAFRMKGDLLGDLRKARHCLDVAIGELEKGGKA